MGYVDRWYAKFDATKIRIGDIVTLKRIDGYIINDDVDFMCGIVIDYDMMYDTHFGSRRWCYTCVFNGKMSYVFDNTDDAVNDERLNAFYMQKA